MRLSVVAGVVALIVVSNASWAADPVAALKSCAALAEPSARLVCYDALAAQLQSAAVSVASPAPVVAPALPQMQVRPEQFGSESLPSATVADAPVPAALDNIMDKVTAVSFSASGRFTVTLANGQVWQQVPGDTDKAYFPRKGDVQVRISRGTIGSYNLSIGTNNAVYKVHRVR